MADNAFVGTFLTCGLSKTISDECRDAAYKVFAADADKKPDQKLKKNKQADAYLGRLVPGYTACHQSSATFGELNTCLGQSRHDVAAVLAKYKWWLVGVGAGLAVLVVLIVVGVLVGRASAE